MDYSDMTDPQAICENLQQEIKKLETPEEKLPVFRSAWGRLKELGQTPDHTYPQKIRNLARLHLLE